MPWKAGTSMFIRQYDWLQKFAEKPKGKDLDAMKVDTTVLGKLAY